jgi:hypothetical protein
LAAKVAYIFEFYDVVFLFRQKVDLSATNTYLDSLLNGVMVRILEKQLIYLGLFL